VDSVGSYVKIKSQTGDPVQLSDLRPVKCESLARIGSTYDGGYIVPLDAVRAATVLVSFGLAHDWTFEQDFKIHNPDAAIHCYDHTVSFRSALRYSAGQLLRFALLFRTGSLRNSFRWIDYKRFFRADKIHFRQKISRDGQNDSATIDDVFSRLPTNSRAFVKMDIEGSEYLVIDDLLRYFRRIVAMAIEFHDVDTNPGLFNSFVERIKRDFYIVHIHGNNMGGVTSFNFPNAPEITFLNKEFCNSVPPPSGLKYPVPGLDRPNHPRLPEFEFEF
jgi:hypothetical protein